jgi:hypothetical protein
MQGAGVSLAVGCSSFVHGFGASPWVSSRRRWDLVGSILMMRSGFLGFLGGGISRAADVPGFGLLTWELHALQWHCGTAELVALRLGSASADK